MVSPDTAALACSPKSLTRAQSSRKLPGCWLLTATILPSVLWVAAREAEAKNRDCGVGDSSHLAGQAYTSNRMAWVSLTEGTQRFSEFWHHRAHWKEPDETPHTTCLATEPRRVGWELTPPFPNLHIFFFLVGTYQGLNPVSGIRDWTQCRALAPQAACYWAAHTAHRPFVFPSLTWCCLMLLRLALNAGLLPQHPQELGTQACNSRSSQIFKN